MDIIYLWIMGFEDSLSIITFSKTIIQNSLIRKILKDIFLFNGIFILAFHYLYNNYIFRHLYLIEFNLPPHTINIYIIIYYLLWIIPVYIISIFYNLSWYLDIANELYKYEKTTQRSTPISNQTSELIYGCLLGQSFLLQICICSYLPFIGKIISFIYSCFLLSFQIFEYRMNKQGLKLHQKIKMVEFYWPYFAGFGTIMSFIYVYISFFYSVAVSNMLFPFFMIITCDKNVSPYKYIPNNQIKYPYFNIFRIAEVILTSLISLTSNINRLSRNLQLKYLLSKIK